MNKYFQLKSNEQVFFAGQITGVEGYMESAMSGLVAAIQGYLIFSGFKPIDFSSETMIGALSNHVATEFGEYSPMNSNFGILSPLTENIRDKSQRKAAYSMRALEKMKKLLTTHKGV